MCSFLVPRTLWALIRSTQVHGAQTTITCSRSESLQIETTAIAILVWLNDDASFVQNTEKAVRWLSERCKV